MWSPSNINENLVVAYAGWEDRIVYAVENVAGSSSRPKTAIGDARSSVSLDEWHHLQFAFAENSDVGVADGQFRMWYDGQLVVDRNDLLTREDYSENKRPRVVGLDSVWGPNTSLGETDRSPNSFFIDDVYLDTTWARIELANSPDYAAATHREMQPFIDNWSDDSATIRWNQGAFLPGDDAYLFLIDTAGEVSAGSRVAIVPEPVVGVVPTLLLVSFALLSPRHRNAWL